MHKLLSTAGQAVMGLALFLTSCQETKDMEQQVNELYNRMSQPARIAQPQSMYMDELFDEQGRLPFLAVRHAEAP